jgi:hypothetical protein
MTPIQRSGAADADERPHPIAGGPMMAAHVAAGYFSDAKPQWES